MLKIIISHFTGIGVVVLMTFLAGFVFFWLGSTDVNIVNLLWVSTIAYLGTRLGSLLTIAKERL